MYLACLMFAISLYYFRISLIVTFSDTFFCQRTRYFIRINSISLECNEPNTFSV